MVCDNPDMKPSASILILAAAISFAAEAQTAKFSFRLNWTASGEHAPFLRQIPSPPSNVRSVKVRFAKAD